MALQMTVKTDHGITVENAYIKIETVSGSKKNIHLDARAYLSKLASDENKQPVKVWGTSFSPSVDAGSENFIHQGYEYLKTLTDFTDAIDV